MIASSIILEHSSVMGWYTFKSFQDIFLVGYVSRNPDLSFFSCIAIEPIYIQSLMIALAYATIPFFCIDGNILMLFIEMVIVLKCSLPLIFLY